MTSACHRVGIAEDPIGAPGHDMGDSLLDRETAAGAGVHLECGDRRNRLHLPRPTASHLDPGGSDQRSTEEVVCVVIRCAPPTARTIASGHGSLSRSTANGSQYQPLVSLACHAPHGVL